MRIGFFAAKGGQGCSTVAGLVACHLDAPVVDCTNTDDVFRLSGEAFSAGAGDTLHAPIVIYDGGDPAYHYAYHSRFDECDHRILVVRGPCVLAMRHAAWFDMTQFDGFVLVDDPLNRGSAHQVTELLGIPCLGVIGVTQEVADAVDHGTIGAIRLRSTEPFLGSISRNVAAWIMEET